MSCAESIEYLHMPLLEINGLTISWQAGAQRQEVVHQLHLRIDQGQTVALVGESGSGKTTTAQAIVGLLPEEAHCDSGTILWHMQGQKLELSTLSADEWTQVRGRHIGFVFQEPMSALNPVLRCGDQLQETIHHHLGLDKERAMQRALEWLQRVQLADAERIYRAWPHQLSGGQRQRVMLAIALCAEPELLIADEPTTALDLLRQRELLALFKELKASLGFSLLFISHDLKVVRQLADYIYVMQQGQVVEKGPVSRLWAHPQHSYTRALLEAIPHVSMKPWVRTEPDKAQPVLRVQRLQVAFAERRGWWWRRTRPFVAVHDASFELYAHETLGIVGPSGCGKTSLVRGLLRLVPARGEVRLGRTNWMGLQGEALRRVRRHVQLIFQDPGAALNPRLPIGEAILEPMRVHGLFADEEERFAQMQQLLEEVGLPAHWHERLPRQLSGGERQRVCIARALACQPRVLICDECVAQLDLTIQKQILELLISLQQRHKLAMLFIAHDLSVVRLVSHRLLVMDSGRIVERGPTETVFSTPQSAMARALVAAAAEGLGEKG